MTRLAVVRRPGALSVAMIVASVSTAVAISLAMDVVLVRYSTVRPVDIVVTALFNLTCVLQSLVGSIIEWRRPGHTMGRLLMLSGPLYAFLAAGWQTADVLKPVVDQQVYRLVNWAGALLSYPGVALIVGWVPLLFPTGTLPGPRWRIPAGMLVVLPTIGTVAWALQPGPLTPGTDLVSPIGMEGWPGSLQPFVDAITFELLALVALAIAALITRYRRGERVERLQIRWFVTAVSLCAAGFVGVAIESTLHRDGPLVTSLVAYAGILAMPIAIGIAVLRYRLYEIDRIISRTLAYALLTVMLVAVYAVGFALVQSVLATFTSGGGAFAVAASTLVVFALFQPLRRRVQGVMDRRFNRTRYDAARTVEGFAARLREEVHLDRLGGELRTIVGRNLAPSSVGVWLRPSPRLDNR